MSSAVVVWVNESAGSGAGRTTGQAALSALQATGVQTLPVVATDPGEASRQARELIADGAGALVCVGGDGTVHHALQVLAGGEVPLGIVPAGSGDDIARAAGFVQSDPTRCLAQISRALSMPVDQLPRMDLGRATCVDTDGTSTVRWFGATLYAGFDARVNARANAMGWPPGRARYPVAMLAELRTFRAAPFKVTIDDEPAWHEQACVAVVANGSSYGGGMQVVPHADAHDGLLDLMLLTDVSRLELLRVFPRVYRGTHVHHPAVRFRRGTSIALEAPGLEAWADGEHVGPLPVTIDVAPGALSLLRP